MATKIDYRRWGSVALVALLVLVAVFRVLTSYAHTAQAFDEPYHIGAAIELLDKGTYRLDPLHPPLQRIAIGIPLYLAAARYPSVSVPENSTEPQAAAVGNATLNDGGHYQRNLALARVGVLPFLLLGCVVVFLWARQEHGDFAGSGGGCVIYDAADCAGVLQHCLYRYCGRGNAGRGLLGFRELAG
jgi:hypothetical protein